MVSVSKRVHVLWQLLQAITIFETETIVSVGSIRFFFIMLLWNLFALQTLCNVVSERPHFVNW